MRLLSESQKAADTVCYSMPETTNEDGTVLKETTADDHTSVCFKKSIFDTPALKGKCVVVKLNGVK